MQTVQDKRLSRSASLVTGPNDESETYLPPGWQWHQAQECPAFRFDRLIQIHVPVAPSPDTAPPRPSRDAYARSNPSDLELTLNYFCLYL